MPSAPTATFGCFAYFASIQLIPNGWTINHPEDRPAPLSWGTISCIPYLQVFIFPQVTLTAERPGPHFQNTPTPRQDTRATIPNCSCPWCSDDQRRPPPTSYHAEQRTPRHYEVSKGRYGAALNLSASSLRRMLFKLWIKIGVRETVSAPP
jgi:hypothetical protein